MLEPLFRCNLACPGCGKIDYEDLILNKRLSVEDCLAAVDECGAPVISIPGGEPLLHKEIDQIVEGIIGRKKFVYLCTNGLLLEKKMHLFKPSKYLTFSVHLDGLEAHHDHAVNQPGTFRRVVAAIEKARDAGFRVNVNCTLFNTMKAEDAARFFDFCMNELRVEGVRGARLRLRARTGTAALSQPHPHQAVVPRRSQVTGQEQVAVQPVGSLHGFPRRQSNLHVHAVGNADAQHLRLATSLLSAVRGLCPQLQGIDGNDGLGPVRDRQLREVRGLHACIAATRHGSQRYIEKALEGPVVKLRGYRTDGPMAPDIPLDNQRPAQFVFESLVKSCRWRSRSRALTETPASGPRRERRGVRLATPLAGRGPV